MGSIPTVGTNGMWRSLASAGRLGRQGRRFKSSHPDVKYKECRECEQSIPDARGQSLYCSQYCKTTSLAKQRVGRKMPTRLSPEDILQYGSPSKRAYLHRSLQAIGRKYICEGCGIGPEWQGKSLTLEIDHIDGDNKNNNRENLRYLCPNCHSQCTDTNRPWKNKRADDGRLEDRLTVNQLRQRVESSNLSIRTTRPLDGRCLIGETRSE